MDKLDQALQMAQKVRDEVSKLLVAHEELQVRNKKLESKLRTLLAQKINAAQYQTADELQTIVDEHFGASPTLKCSP